MGARPPGSGLRGLSPVPPPPPRVSRPSFLPRCRNRIGAPATPLETVRLALSLNWELRQLEQEAGNDTTEQLLPRQRFPAGARPSESDRQASHLQTRCPPQLASQGRSAGLFLFCCSAQALGVFTPERKSLTAERSVALTVNPLADEGSWPAGGPRLCGLLVWGASEPGGTNETAASDSDSESHGDHATSAPGPELAGTPKSCGQSSRALEKEKQDRLKNASLPL